MLHVERHGIEAGARQELGYQRVGDGRPGSVERLAGLKPGAERL